MSQEQLWNAGQVRTLTGGWAQKRRDQRKTADGSNKLRMEQRQATKQGMTLAEYRQRKQQHHITTPITLAVRAANNRYRTHHALRAAVDTQAEERKHRRYKQYYAENKDKYYLARYKRRALEKTTQHEHIDRIKVFERDNWRCRYCRRKTSDAVKQGHPRKAIMGHINALAAGGTHTWDNVCCLCHECNSRDGINRIPLQTSIF